MCEGWAQGLGFGVWDTSLPTALKAQLDKKL